MNDTALSTWEKVVAAKVGHIFIDRFVEGMRFLIMRGPSSLCAYVGVPLDHPLAGFEYDALLVNAHGGLTYSQSAAVGAKGTMWPEGFWWYGWDYAHAGDFCIFDKLSYSGKRWTPSDVETDSLETLENFKRLMLFAEQIAALCAAKAVQQ